MRFQRGGQSAQRLLPADLPIHPRDRLGGLAVSFYVRVEPAVPAKLPVAEPDEVLPAACACVSWYAKHRFSGSRYWVLPNSYCAKVRRDLLVERGHCHAAVAQASSAK
jgi:hypothetical protein